MERFIKILFGLFALIFYTFLMVLVDDITIDNQALKWVIHFGALLLVAILLYLIIKFILKKLKMLDKKAIYQITVWNIVIGIFFPVILIILIPNETLTVLAFMLIVSTVYYGFLIDIIICLLNHFLTK